VLRGRQAERLEQAGFETPATVEDPRSDEQEVANEEGDIGVTTDGKVLRIFSASGTSNGIWLVTHKNNGSQRLVQL